MSNKNAVNNLAKIYSVSRKYPVIGAKKLLNIDLAYYQKDILNKLWNNKYPLLNCSRRTGKTFLCAVYISLRCLMYPDTKVIIFAPVFNQAQTLFLLVEEIYKNSLLMQTETSSRPKHGSSEWRLKFKNGSKISAMTLSDSKRSKGANIIIVDEYGFPIRGSMNKMVDSIVKPMLFTKSESAENLEGHIGNQLIISSTSTFKWNDFYKKVMEYEDNISNGKDNYTIVSYDVIDGLKGGKFENELVINEFKNADPITRKMEYLNIFPDGEDGFINYKLLDEKAIDYPELKEDGSVEKADTKVEFEQPYDEHGLPKYEYIMAIDEANQGSDLTAVNLIKIDDNIKRLVRLVTLEDDYIQDRIDVIRELLRKFNVVQIVADQRHSGVKNGLAEPYKYKDGYMGSIIVDEDDKEQIKRIKREHGSNADIKKLLKIHNFSNATNEKRARHFLNEIEKGRFKIPANPKDGFQSKTEEDAYNEIKQTIYEITTIKIKPSGNRVKYEPESATQTDDRWTVCELGCYMADEYIKSKYKMTTENFVIGKRGGR